MTSVPAHYGARDAALETAWALLEDGAARADAEFHTPVLATTAADGAANVRTVVLRAVDRAARELICHTDVRTAKAPEIGADGRVMWLFYDRAEKVQLRVHAVAELHRADSLARARWEASRLSSRRCYLAPEPPGTAADGPTSGLPAPFEARPPDEDESEAGWPHFAVVRSVATRIEWLYLAARGHRRAAFDWNETEGRFVGRWLVP